MFARLVTKSLRERWDRVLVAVLAIMLGAAMVASLLTISFDISEKMGGELRSYGANLVVYPDEGWYIDSFESLHPSIIGWVPFQYFEIEIRETKVRLAGTDFEAAAKMNPWWYVEGKFPEQGEVLAGINAAGKLSLEQGDNLMIEEHSFKVSGILDTGTADDDRIFLPMEDAEKISGRSGANTIYLSVLGDVDEAAGTLESENYRVKKIRQVADTEKELLDKTRLLMSIVSISVLAAALLGLMSTMITGVLERSREIGLMKSLGCSNGRVAAIFFAEAGVMGTIGGTFGYAAGLILAQFIGLEIFDTSVSLKPEVFVLTLFISIFIALIGSLFPVRRAVSIDPVIALRGE
ncbi:MAG: ABC transporter permease [ANME-2 cluster archaeon]|nr:ABC transporter permease [ANME-2 cluster archaeon]